MQNIIIILLVLIIFLISYYSIYFLVKKHYDQELKIILSDKDRLLLDNKAITLEKDRLLDKIQFSEKEMSELKIKITKYEIEAERRESELSENIKLLDVAKKGYDDEKAMIRKIKEDEQRHLFEEKTRAWNDYENKVIAKLRDSCKKPYIWFTFYENNCLPPEFLSLKPDFLVEFLWQYIIFDAKQSEKRISKYIPEQVKFTAQKYKWNKKIYNTIFFVVSYDEIKELQNLSYFEEWFNFFIVSIDSIDPILANFKRISDYSNIKDFDPQDREIIINLLAKYDRHISLQNATNIYFTKNSIDLMSWEKQLNEKIQEDLRIKHLSMRTNRINEWDITKIAQSISKQWKEIEDLISPKIDLSEIEKSWLI